MALSLASQEMRNLRFADDTTAAVLYGGAAIASLYWDEGFGASFYFLAIPGAANAGWSTMTIGATVLTRASATYVAGTWRWDTIDSAATQVFGGLGTVKTVVFA